MRASLFRDRDFRPVAALTWTMGMALGAMLLSRRVAAFIGIRNTAELGAFAAGGVLVAAIGARGTLAYAGGLSALAGLAGVLALLRMNRSWVPTSPTQPVE